MCEHSEIEWKPLHILSGIGSSVAGTLKPAGLENSKDIVSDFFLKDPTDPAWKDDAGYKWWLDFMDKHYPSGDKSDSSNAFAPSVAATRDAALGRELGLRSAMAVPLEWRGREPQHGERVQVHHGTRESAARLAWLGGRFYQVRLEAPLMPAAGDRIEFTELAFPGNHKQHAKRWTMTSHTICVFQAHGGPVCDGQAAVGGDQMLLFHTGGAAGTARLRTLADALLRADVPMPAPSGRTS